MPKAGDLLPLIHPGEMLREEFMVPMGLTAYALAQAMQVPRTRIERIIREESGISSDTALRLERALGASAEFWINLQSRYDLRRAKRSAEGKLDSIPRLVAAE